MINQNKVTKQRTPIKESVLGDQNQADCNLSQLRDEVDPNKSGKMADLKNKLRDEYEKEQKLQENSFC